MSYMQAVAAAAPHLPFYLYDIDFITGIHCERASVVHARRISQNNTLLKCFDAVDWAAGRAYGL